MAFSSPNFASCNPFLSSKGRYIAIDSQNPSSEISIVEIKRSAESDCRFLAVKAVLRDRDFNGKETTFEIRSTLQSGGGDVAAEKKDSDIADLNSFADIDDGGCNGDCNSGNGRFRRGGGGDGDGDGRDDREEEEFGVLLKSDEVIREVEARGLSLPRDMLEAAKTIGIRKDLLLRYFDLQVVVSHVPHLRCNCYVTVLARIVPVLVKSLTRANFFFFLGQVGPTMIPSSTGVDPVVAPILDYWI